MKFKMGFTVLLRMLLTPFPVALAAFSEALNRSFENITVPPLPFFLLAYSPARAPVSLLNDQLREFDCSVLPPRGGQKLDQSRIHEAAPR